MSAHTPCRLVAVNFSRTSNLETADGEKLVAQSLTAADARRLAACWNACEGFETDLLVNIDMMGDTLKQRFEGMQVEVRRVDADSRAIEANYEAARALLTDVLSTSARTSVNMALTERINKFLKAPK